MPGREIAGFSGNQANIPKVAAYVLSEVLFSAQSHRTLLEIPESFRLCK
jgi:hypothetical protein